MKASRNRDENDDIGRRKVTTREPEAKAQVNAAKKGESTELALGLSSR